ncbi:unnamed protein product, partial [Brassica rapa subsp. trilocularis]
GLGWKSRGRREKAPQIAREKRGVDEIAGEREIAAERNGEEGRARPNKMRGPTEIIRRNFLGNIYYIRRNFLGNH